MRALYRKELAMLWPIFAFCALVNSGDVLTRPLTQRLDQASWSGIATYIDPSDSGGGLAFFILGAAVLYGGRGEGLPGSVDGMLARLADMYAPVLGPRVALAFIVVGAFAVLYSTLVASTAANARMLTDFLRVNGFIAPPGPAERFRWVRRFSAGWSLCRSRPRNHLR